MAAKTFDLAFLIARILIAAPTVVL